MGYDTRQFEVRAFVSRHNDERDDEHDALWDELCERIRQLANEPRYAPIEPYT